MNKYLSLSPRERQMIDLLARGQSNKEIARHLNVSANTVKFHLKNAYRKLRVGRRTHAVAVAVAGGAYHAAAAS